MDKKQAILIVDDSVIIVDRLTELISDLQNIKSIVKASTYAEGIAMLQQSKPDIAVLDINLPDKSGIEVLKYIKSNLPSIVVIMFSNQGNEYYRDLCKSLGADYFVDKSKGFDEIPDIISSI